MARAGFITNTSVFILLVSQYQILAEQWLQKELLLALAFLPAFFFLLIQIMPRVDAFFNRQYLRIMEEKDSGQMSPEELKLSRDTILRVPWQAGLQSTFIWITIAPVLYVFFVQRLGGANRSWWSIEQIALSMSPIIFLSNLLAFEFSLRPFLEQYFPAGDIEQYGSIFALTQQKRLFLFFLLIGPCFIGFLLVEIFRVIQLSPTKEAVIEKLTPLPLYLIAIFVLCSGFIFIVNYSRKKQYERNISTALAVAEDSADSTVISSGNSIQTSAPLVSISENLVGSSLDGKYLLLDILGKGGMSTVYLARHQLVDKIVAVKVLSGEIAGDPRVHRRLKQESKAAMTLEHPNIVLVRDFGVANGRIPYMVMDYVEGISLSTLLKQGPLPKDRIVCILKQVCAALSCAHANKIVHRDIKPSNIMLATRAGAETQEVKLVDFGIAKIDVTEGSMAERLTQTGEILGSPPYMSPEQCSGMKLDARSDIYSLGCVLYEMLTGDPPFLGDSFLAIMVQHMQNDVDLERVVGEMRAIVARSLAKNPDERFQSINEFAAALDST